MPSLQWLSDQKMEGILCRWALAMQEFSFEISYCKGSLNGNADALSRCIDCGEVDTADVTTTEVSLAEIIGQHNKGMTGDFITLIYTHCQH